MLASDWDFNQSSSKIQSKHSKSVNCSIIVSHKSSNHSQNIITREHFNNNTEYLKTNKKCEKKNSSQLNLDIFGIQSQKTQRNEKKKKTNKIFFY